MAHRRGKSTTKKKRDKKRKINLRRTITKAKRELRKRTIEAIKKEYREWEWKIRSTYIYYRNVTIADIIRDWWFDAYLEVVETYRAFAEMDRRKRLKLLYRLLIKGHAIRFDFRRTYTREEIELYLTFLDTWLEHLDILREISRTGYLGIPPDAPNFGRVLGLAELYYAPLRTDECHSTASAIKVTDLTLKILQGDNGTAYVIIAGNFEHIGWSPYTRRADTNHGVEPFFILLMAKKRRGERLSIKIGSGYGTIGKDMQVVLMSNNLRIPEEVITIKQLLDDPNQILRLRAESIGRPESATKLKPCSVYVVLRPTKYGRDRKVKPDEGMGMRWWKETDKYYFVRTRGV
mgnify:CR=1 FL=1